MSRIHPAFISRVKLFRYCPLLMLKYPDTNSPENSLALVCEALGAQQGHKSSISHRNVCNHMTPKEYGAFPLVLSEHAASAVMQ